jgi:hypothetical protein
MPEVGHGQPRQDLVPGSRTERPFDDVPHLDVRDPPRPQCGPELPEGQIGPRAEGIRSSLHTPMEWEMLKGVERVVVDEDADGPLVRQHVTRR